MKQDVFIKGREYEAYATYESGKITVHKGSKLGFPRTAAFKRTKQAYSLRDDKSFVRDGIVIKDCVFNSPSTAAQFITGGSRNGYDTWKVKKGYPLGRFLEDNGLRIQNKSKKG